MVNGLRCDIPNEWGRYLFDILKGIDIHKYNWHVDNDEVIICSKDNEYKSLFDSTSLRGEELYDRICNEKYYVIFLELTGQYGTSNIPQIETYNDFVEGNCEIFLVVTDCSYLEVYCKNSDELKIIERNLKELSLIPETITEETLRSSLLAF